MPSNYPTQLVLPQHLARIPGQRILPHHNSRHPFERSLAEQTGRVPFSGSTSAEDLEPNSADAVYLSVLQATELKAVEESPKPRWRRDSLTLTPDYQNRISGVTKQLVMLAGNPASVKSILAPLMLKRRAKNPLTCPYPVEKKEAWRYVIREWAKVQKAVLDETEDEQGRQMRLAKARRAIELEKIKKMGQELDTMMARRRSPMMLVTPPARRNSMPEVQSNKGDSASENDKPPGESGSDQPITQDDGLHHQSHSPITPKENSNCTNISTKKADQVVQLNIQSSTTKPRTILVQRGTKKVRFRGSGGKGATESSETPSPSRQAKGKQKMTPEEQIQLVREARDEAKKDLRFLRNLQSHAKGAEPFHREVEEAEIRYARLVAVEGKGIDPDFCPPGQPLSSAAKALIRHGTEIIRTGKGPSTTDYRKQNSLRLFGTPKLPFVGDYEFDSPVKEESEGEEEEEEGEGTEEAEEEAGEGAGGGDRVQPETDLLLPAPQVPDVIIVTEFDHRHNGIQILILPEPTDESTMMDTSIVIPCNTGLVQTFAILIVELSRTTASVNSSEETYASKGWRGRASRLRDVLDRLRESIPVKDMANASEYAALLGEYGALEMTRFMSLGFWTMLGKLRAEERKRAKVEEFLRDAHAKLATLVKQKDTAALRRLQHDEEAGKNVAADSRLLHRFAKLQEYEDFLQEVSTQLVQKPTEDTLLDPLIVALLQQTALYAWPAQNVASRPGHSPAAYAPDGDQYVAELRKQQSQRKPISIMKAPMVSDLRAKSYCRPAELLAVEVQMDALVTVGALRGRSRGAVRLQVLPKPVSTSERRRLPEEDWLPNVRVEFQSVGRSLICNNYGVFTWLNRRPRLDVLVPMVLPVGTGCFTGEAQTRYFESDMVKERWQFEGFKQYEMKILGPQFGQAWVAATSLQPQPLPPRIGSWPRPGGNPLRDEPPSDEEAKTKTRRPESGNRNQTTGARSFDRAPDQIRHDGNEAGCSSSWVEDIADPTRIVKAEARPQVADGKPMFSDRVVGAAQGLSGMYGIGMRGNGVAATRSIVESLVAAQRVSRWQSMKVGEMAQYSDTDDGYLGDYSSESNIE
ncbi:hypothetical protein DRE_00918 [Drechslerella stenobrocha 248]|uniref:Uncharacterized protein n=1 Tax=Drechslerella stenobrocha 248 TaxID=1043628 RepID=W7HNY6_9PEZI|nr:hypothetical protein DRE_00918 [Drechslerella stenobrocha 248]